MRFLLLGPKTTCSWANNLQRDSAYQILNIIVFSELENVLSTEQCRYNVPTKNKNSPTNIQQTVAMSNNDDMEIDLDRGRGLRGMTDKSEQQKARGNKSDHRGLEEREREQQQREYIRK
jgi:hypothetical protein